MLRSFTRQLSNRLLDPKSISLAGTDSTVKSSVPACLSLCRRLSADPVTEEDLRAAAAAGPAGGRQAAIHEQLVFELFAIRERVRESIRNREYGQAVPKRIRRQDEPNLYLVPLRVLLERMRTEAGEADEAVLRAWDRQIRVESSALEATIQNFREGVADMLRRGEGPNLSGAQRLMVGWFNPLRTLIAEEQQAVRHSLSHQAPRAGGDGGEGKDPMQRHSYGPYLLLLHPDQLTVLTMHAVLGNLLGGYFPVNSRRRQDPRGQQYFKQAGRTKLTDVSFKLGQAVQSQVIMEQLRVRVAEENAVRDAARRAWQAAVKRAGSDVDLTKDAQAIGADPELQQLILRSWQEVRANQNLPEDVQNWIEHLEPLDINARLKAIRRKVLDKHQEGTTQISRSRIKLQHARAALAESAYWPTDKLVKVGALLVDLFLRATRDCVVRQDPGMEVDPDNPDNRAFWHSVELSRSRLQKDSKQFWKRQGVIRCHDNILKELASTEQMQNFMLLHKQPPMVIPPLPWRSLDSGGYILTRSFLVRIAGNGVHRQALVEAQNSAEGRLSQVYAALNAIGDLAWAINRPMLEVVEQAWKSGEPICELPSQQHAPMLPPPSSRRFMTARAGRQLLAQATTAETMSEARARRAANEARRKVNRETHSMRCDLSLKLQVAREFREEPVMYFPHDLDFRGRAYPIHPHLNHMGPDLCRGLLTFAEARPLGEHGFDWLLVQIANSWGRGVDKGSFSERRKFALANLHNIVDSAERPLEPTASRWWQQAEDPWQALGGCMEVRDALAWGDVSSFPSRLPVQVDGSCNGLQHYAALGRDSEGGAAVNLRPASRPQDVYSQVADVVRGIVAADAAEGQPEAVALAGIVDRKLVKQTVMTSVYGVTHFGARDQISSRLRERGWGEGMVLEGTTLNRVADYAARITRRGLAEKFEKAITIMGWLGECAKVVAAHGHCMEWVTPMGLPVIQPYRRKEEHIVVTVLQRLKLHRDSERLPVMKGRQKTAFPPNYIHSLDSSHMMLTALACQRAGVAFAGVHDSFWTHAGDMPVLNRLLRETFVELHSKPLLEMLLDGLRKRFPEIKPELYPDIPDLGSLDLAEVQRSEYFFS